VKARDACSGLALTAIEAEHDVSALA